MQDLTTMFAALGDPTRFSIVERLLAEGELSAGELQSGFDLSAPAISRHLNVLRKAGLLDRRAKKQQRIYSIRPDTMQSISNWVERHRAFWDGSLTRLEHALMAERDRK